MEGVAENLVELRKIKEGVIMSEDTDEEKQRVREKIEKRIRQQFDYQKRNMNDRFKNLGSISDMICLLIGPVSSSNQICKRIFSADLEHWKDQIAKEFGINFDDDLTQI